MAVDLKKLNASSDQLLNLHRDSDSRVINRRTLLKRSLLGAIICPLGIGALKAAKASGDSLDWGYTGSKGPDAWGQLSNAYTLCSSGTEQSPINLTQTAVQPASLTLNYQATPLTIQNNGRTIRVDCAAGSMMQLDGVLFELQQFHFHAPSEHLENGRAAAMEVHFVHQNLETQALAVLGVFFKAGDRNEALQPIWNHMPQQAGIRKTLRDSNFNAASLLPTNREEFYRYSGSLTTPPCSESVTWIVMQQAITVSVQQVARFTQAIGEPNARPVQPQRS
ncbi:MAG: carbonic anhydrase family protein [Cyanobacteria bacterium P01_H01_bin.21]